MQRLNPLILISLVLIVPSVFSNTASDSKGSKEPEWLGGMRELIFKTISPSPSANNELYKSFLEAPFYGAPNNAQQQQQRDRHATALVARGDVYYLATKGRWILCQEGCTDCAECLLQSSPSLKWTLRRVLVQEQRQAFNSSRHELQLTVVPQLDDSFHMRNLRRRSHIYMLATSTRESSAKKRRKLGRKRSIAAKAPLKRSRPNASVVETLREERHMGRRSKKQLLRVIPVDLKQDQSFLDDPLAWQVSSSLSSTEDASGSSYYQRQMDFNGKAKTDGNYSEILGRLSLLLDPRRKSDNDSLTDDLESLSQAYENFVGSAQTEKSEDSTTVKLPVTRKSENLG